MNEQYVYFKGERKLFGDMSLEERDNFWKDIDDKYNKNKGITKMKIITEKEYRDFVKLRTELNELILAKAAQMCFIQYNRAPEGTCYNQDFEEENGKICVQFVSYHCQEQDNDTFYLPLEFLFDESYPEKYKLIWEEEKRKEKEEMERKKLEKEIKDKEAYERYDRKEYERLKLKYEKKG